MSIPRQLLTYLNSGKCFALIGSGLSTALEYPSWWHMAKDATALLPDSDPEQTVLTELIGDKDYLEVFERVAGRLGGVSSLLPELKKSFGPKKDRGEAYEIICRWPIRCYLTTNYDDEIDNHLQRLGQHFTLLRNSQAELGQITANSQHRIVKLHGDLDSPDGIVLTTSQYTEFEAGGGRQYFRNKLVSIFQMVPLIVLGHSMTDRDFQLILRLAKESASPENPIYMLVADASRAETDKLHREFNIRLLSYPNPDRSFKNLTQLLRQVDRFVVPRTSEPTPPLDFPDAEEAEQAVSLYVHSALGFGGDVNLIQKTIQPQILSLAASKSDGIAAEHIKVALRPNTLQDLPSIASEIETAITHLTELENLSATDTQLTVTTKGKELLAETEARQSSEEDQFFGAMKSRLLKHGAETDVEILVSGFKAALVTVFRKRGLAAAELLFRDNPFEPADMPELFDAVFPPATSVDDFTLRAEYCNAVMDVLTAPNDDQKNYLAHLAQGFFAYHMFGIDPSGQEVRKRLVQGTLWLFDSNILIPLVAPHSFQHGFMTGLLDQLKALGIRPVTTPKLISEVDRALGWLQSRLAGVLDGEERQALLEVTQRPDYSENPFLDAFVEGNVIGAWRSKSEFLEAIGHEDGIGMRSAIQSLDIDVIEPSDIDPSGDATIDSLSDEIFKERERAGTIRAGDVQAQAEGEALHILRYVRRNGFRGDDSIRKAYFISTSRLLDIIYRRTDGLITWYPESLNNHLAYLNGATVDADAAFHAITTSFYSAGISVIDEPAYKKYFKPAISEANATLKREIDNYVNSVARSVQDQQSERESILKGFQRTPDVGKSLFVEQMGWKAARRAEERLAVVERQKQEAERKGKEEVASVKAEYERKENERKRHEEGRKRNLADPKHQRKRQRQAKRRKKKGKGKGKR
ncbi:hypothetical protein DTL42_14105 [Bremerella cremea]|uniref:SIR2-like domain-containing protein n=1 Tax=Bremerella cremea TaxID=1031537 RepID=A0A368KPV1_9BACT|nr:SIR2 family protein [Bremerella cremea]RCS47651.1 hypothetical protein DTL42_14105 [Bremerella cremea]